MSVRCELCGKCLGIEVIVGTTCMCSLEQSTPKLNLYELGGGIYMLGGARHMR